MSRIAIIHHGNLGYIRSIAEYIAQGASEAQADITLYSALDAKEDPGKLDDFDAIIFGSPTYFGSVSAEIKLFMDSTSKIWLTKKWKDKIAAGFTCANSPSGDQLNTLMQMFIFACQHGMIWAGLDLSPKLPDYGEVPQVYNKLGSWIGYSFQVRSEEGEKLNFTEVDIKSAIYFGERIAGIAKKYNLKR